VPLATMIVLLFTYRRLQTEDFFIRHFLENMQTPSQ